jgi:FKBP-type peptidyl-prolyl cis-trans isomerase FkpA
MPNIPPDAKELVYKIKVKRIFDEAGYQVYTDSMTVAMQARFEAGQTRVSELEKFTQEKLKEYKSGKLNMYTSESGLGLIVFEAGKGEKFVNGDIVNTHYYGFLEDGTMFDNSFSRGKPMNFTLGNKNVIPGWEEGFTYLQRKSKAMLVIPPDLAYGQEMVGTIPPGSTLYFYLEIQ